MKTTGAAEYVTLPSRGKIYTPAINPEILLDSMTTINEQQRIAPSDLSYKPLSDILDECIKNEFPMSAYDLCIGDWQFLLYKLRAVTYGAQLKLNVKCPVCLSQHEVIVSLDDLDIINDMEKIEELRTITLPKTGQIVTLKMQTPRGLDQIARKTKDFRQRRKGTSEDPTFIYNIENCIGMIDGVLPDPATFDDWVKALPMMDTITILNASKALNETIGVDNDLALTCETCGQTYKTQFQITSEFFRPTTLY